ncbi:MAG: hypothetical protein Q8P60_01095 [Pseudorhodobacter sp.]|nr:hypothetical protein [Pseudorhodobacter sp.]
MKIAFLHTAEAHITTFDALLARRAPDVRVTHRVEAGLLRRAMAEGLAAVQEQTLAVLTGLCSSDAVVCTCSTLGPVADDLARNHRHVFRVDRPMLQRAVALGSELLIAICLESTRGPCLELLADCSRIAGRSARPTVVLCDQAWPYFAAGDQEQFHKVIAAKIRAKVAATKGFDAVVLAQASMMGTAPLLADLGMPILSSPELAVEHALELGLRP